ncbi:DNA repair protein RecN [Vagococcus humatus]|uniref:DNA repair protein RecN n=1 Tax=Vagococcus humatus TaxID=1889241 RepID=A0A3S0ADT6_9ENTE|nr:DNA repair protein RecN [Vagococcus humatus]RST89455.1 DNA repair protein RecN [Vagococcus humatus]
MLQELSIQNFAIISSLSVSFQQGMTVLTGETGAGKSIIIDAVGLLVGGRGSVDFIREGANKCIIEGQFLLPKQTECLDLLEKLEIDTSDQMLVIHRSIDKNGKNVCRVNNSLVNIGTLKQIGVYLIDIHGQHEHQELLNPESHLNLLDTYGTLKLASLKKEYQDVYVKYVESHKKVSHLKNNEQAFAQRLDMLHYQCEEIEAAELQVGEEAALVEERHRLLNFQKIADALGKSYAALQEGELSGIDRIGVAMNEMLDIESLDLEFKAISELLQTSYYQLMEASSQISGSLENMEMDQERLEDIEGRLDLLRQLKRKYGHTEEDILAYYEKITEELAVVQSDESHLDELEQECQLLFAQAKELARKLSDKRQEVARELEKELMKQLQELYMEKTVIQVQLKAQPDKLTDSGFDKVEFFISTNLGESLKPLAKIVSGGELSRIMLGMKTIFSKKQGVTSIIFDEVDTGVSGRVAQGIANKIYRISKNSQVLCITHLPQVAAMADTQYYIAKQVEKNRTITQVSQLTKEERIQELSRMLAGEQITHLTQEHAEELLQLADAEKKKEEA